MQSWPQTQAAEEGADGEGIGARVSLLRVGVRYGGHLLWVKLAFAIRGEKEFEYTWGSSSSGFLSIYSRYDSFEL